SQKPSMAPESRRDPFGDPPDTLERALLPEGARPVGTDALGFTLSEPALVGDAGADDHAEAQELLNGLEERHAQPESSKSGPVARVEAAQLHIGRIASST